MMTSADLLTLTPDWDSLIADIEDQERAKIYPHPSDERLLVRRLSMTRLLGETGLSSPNVLTTSGPHFKKLQELGMSIPASTHRLVVSSEPTLYSVVERVLQVDASSEAPIAPVNPILQRYYAWAQTGNESHYLADIIGNDQYVTGRLASEPLAPVRRYLVDIDPYMWPYGSQPNRQAQQRLSLVHDVLEVLPQDF